MLVVLGVMPCSDKDESNSCARELRSTDKEAGEWTLGQKMLDSRTKKKKT